MFESYKYPESIEIIIFDDFQAQITTSPKIWNSYAFIDLHIYCNFSQLYIPM